MHPLMRQAKQPRRITGAHLQPPAAQHSDGASGNHGRAPILLLGFLAKRRVGTDTRIAGSGSELGCAAAAASTWPRRRRSEKPSPRVVFLPFSDRRREGRQRVCPEVCPNRVPKTSSTPTLQSTLVVVFSGKGDGLNAGRLHRFAVERFRVSGLVTYTCRRPVRWPRG